MKIGIFLDNLDQFVEQYNTSISYLKHFFGDKKFVENIDEIHISDKPKFIEFLTFMYNNLDVLPETSQQSIQKLMFNLNNVFSSFDALFIEMEPDLKLLAQKKELLSFMTQSSKFSFFDVNFSNTTASFLDLNSNADLTLDEKLNHLKNTMYNLKNSSDSILPPSQTIDPLDNLFFHCVNVVEDIDTIIKQLNEITEQNIEQAPLSPKSKMTLKEFIQNFNLYSMFIKNSINFVSLIQNIRNYFDEK